MFFKTFCAAVIGVEAKIVRIEADVNAGLPVFQMVGYLNSEVKEAKERVRSSIKNIGLSFPPKRITVNLSPADFRKEGTSYDLGVAVALLGAFGCLDFDASSECILVGELSLDGRINGVAGVLPIAMAARENGFRYCIVPKANIKEAAIVEGIKSIGVESLEEALNIIQEKSYEARAVATEEWNDRNEHITDKDFSDVSGQFMIKRAAMIAVAGNHNMLMQGASGAGKTMIAERIPGIMPSLTREESLEVIRINSICGVMDKAGGYIYDRPFRAPHHSISPTGLIGGGAVPKAGEISLAHKGVLFLDELTEFKRSTLELLRIPLENKKIIHTRNNGSVEFPCDFTLIAAMNPCPCGNYPNKLKCTCSPMQIKRYLGRLSTPLLDRIDIITQVKEVEYSLITGVDQKDVETSYDMRKKIEKVVSIQHDRFKDENILYNSSMDGRMIKKYCVLDKESRQYIEKIYNDNSMSARGYYKVLKVARTIADFAGKERIDLEDIEEAVMYRCIDRNVYGER